MPEGMGRFGRYEGRDARFGGKAMSEASEPKRPTFGAERRWAHVQTFADVAKLLETSPGALRYALYTAAPEQRYRTFEIPKRTGGMRTIDAPLGVIRDAQTFLAPLIAAAYEAHPAAHGFLPERNILTNAVPHVGQRLVLNIDLADFFPSVNFGRVRGIFMAAPFGAGPAAATVLAQICTHRNGLPQGAPTSPALSNLAAATLDRRLTRLARENGVKYARYADDITFSTSRQTLPVPLAEYSAGESGLRVRAGEALERAVTAAGFAINPKKVRLQGPHQRQSVTGLVVNAKPNVERERVRRLRAMLHAWRKFGVEAAGREHFAAYRIRRKPPERPGRAFREVVYGELAFLKMIRGQADPLFLKLCAQLLDLDPNPSRFLRQMVFGAADYDVFISHASEDKETIARPIYEACAKLGVKAFLDEEHIGWGESFTKKINTALGAARTVLCVVSSNSVAKEWPVLEMNAALSFEVSKQKRVVALMVGRPDLSKLPLMAAKDYLDWSGDPNLVARKLRDVAQGGHATTPPARPPNSARPRWLGGDGTSLPATEPPTGSQRRKRSIWEILFGRRRP